MELYWTSVWVCWATYIVGIVASLYIAAWICDITVDPHRLLAGLGLVCNGFTAGLGTARLAYKAPRYMQL